MAILDFLTGQKNIDRMKQHGEDYARSAYDPSQVDPMVQFGQQTAQEGIDVDNVLQGLMSQTYRNIPRRTGGISQGQQLAADLQTDEMRTATMGQAATQVGIQDDEVKRQGRQTVAQALTSRNELQSKRDAGVAEARLMAEAESGRRRQSLLGAGIGLASAAFGGGKSMLEFLSKDGGGATLASKDPLSSTGVPGLSNFLAQ
jgi:hypothetical protein